MKILKDSVFSLMGFFVLLVCQWGSFSWTSNVWWGIKLWRIFRIALWKIGTFSSTKVPLEAYFQSKRSIACLMSSVSTFGDVKLGNIMVMDGECLN